MLGPNGERISASAFESAEQCLFRWAANKKEHPWDKSSSKAARIGTAVHHMIEVDLTKKSKPLPKDITQQEQGLAMPFYHQWVNAHRASPFVGDAEAKLWWRPSTRAAGKEVGGASRGYGELPWDGWIGTADLWTPTEVIDWKTGKHQVNPESSAQMAMLAYLTHKVGGEESVKATVVQISPNDIVTRSHTFDAFELFTIGNRLDVVLERITLKQMDPRPSEDACRWCPIKKTCPQAYDKTRVKTDGIRQEIF